MLATIRRTIARAVDFAHNLYAKADPAIQTFLALAAIALFAAAQGFNWTIPTTGAQFQTELAAIAAVAYAIVVPLFQKFILPNLLGWLIVILRIIPETQPKLRTAKANAYGTLPRAVILWRVAA
jgi:hypothetical protein